MAHRDAIVARADEILETHRWPEFAQPGLQVIGKPDVGKLVCGVSANLALLQRAVAAGADMVIVHHGLFWRNEPLVVDARLRGRLETLFHADCSLVAYHLALDAHPTLGNNAQLAVRIGATVDGTFGAVGAACSLPELAIEELVARLAEHTRRPPLHLPGGPAKVRRVAVSTGAAGYALIEAAHQGFEVLVTGEPEEPNAATARELGIHLVAAGHHATERYGVQALAELLAGELGVDWEFIDVDNPV